ncbi:hypothetical protein PybrP1_003053 [[Pythium] brassicae (nom. inval.)]|nr:hypothetical protein PybrP1_003053 [[Pythium] brassicae (nom. inval.)]
MSSSSDEDGNGSGGSDWSSNASSSDYGGALSDADADGSQRARHWTAGSGAASAAIAAYTEALRTTASHRESISTGAASGAIYMLSEDTRRRHRDSKKRVEAAERTQQLLLKTHELGAVADDVPLWVHACVIPPRWRQQIVAHVAPIRAQMAFCQERVLGAWQLLLPPFDRANLAEFEARVALLERSIALLEAALVLCQQQAEAGEREAASGFIQLWYRQRLAKRGFYTRTVRIGRRERGLIPGLFDSTVGLSKLTVDHRRHQATLEFPAPSAPTSTPRAPAFR